jgi:hypothetical protein
MASGTIPEFYKYAPVPIDSTGIQKSPESTIECAKTGENNDKVRYFTDGGVLSNTPFRELLSAHKEYWEDVEKIDEIPDLDVYIVNVHASKVDAGKVRPEDYEGVKERHSDLKYCDRTSHYDEENAHLIADYAKFCIQLRELVDDVISQTNNENEKRQLEEKLSRILSTKTHDHNSPSYPRKYEALAGSAINLNVVMRIERGSYVNDVSRKTGDLTLETINKLLKEGKCDTWFSIIEKSIYDLKLDDRNKHILISELDMVWQKLRERDYEDNDSHVYHLLANFIENVKDKQKLEAYQSDILVKPAKELLAILN